MQQLAPSAETTKPMKLCGVKMTYVTLFLPLLLWQVRMQERKLLQIHNSLIFRRLLMKIIKIEIQKKYKNNNNA